MLSLILPSPMTESTVVEKTMWKFPLLFSTCPAQATANTTFGSEFCPKHCQCGPRRLLHTQKLIFNHLLLLYNKLHVTLIICFFLSSFDNF